MKSTLYSVLILIATLPAAAGLTYDFSTVTSGAAASTQTAHAAVQGSDVRLEFEKGDGMVFKDGAIALSHDAGSTLYVLDPGAKTYYLIDLDAVGGGGMLGMLQLSNEKVNVRDAGDGGVIQGFPTRRTIVTAGADVAVGTTVSMHLDVTMETWSTDKLPADAASFLSRKGASTGLPILDKLIAAQSKASKGFPLKQTTTVHILQGGRETVGMTANTTVTNVRNAAIAKARFALPAGFRKTESPFDKLTK
jgi:hypothetical protein